MKKRILALLLTAAMALSVAGCGSSDAPAKDANAQPTTQATEEKDVYKRQVLGSVGKRGGTDKVLVFFDLFQVVVI